MRPAALRTESRPNGGYPSCRSACGELGGPPRARPELRSGQKVAAVRAGRSRPDNPAAAIPHRPLALSGDLIFEWRVIVDGGKGLRAAVRKAFRHRALVQRCQWHKRENVVSYLAKSEQPVRRQRLQRAYNRPECASRSTTRPSPPSSRSSMSWRIGTNPRPAVWRKASTRP